MWTFSENELKEQEVLFQKAFVRPQKCYKLSLCFAVRLSRLFAEAKFGWKIC